MTGIREFLAATAGEEERYHRDNLDPGVMTQSKASTWLGCHARYEFQYHDRLPFRSTAPIELGNSFDATANYTYRDAGEPVRQSVEETLDAFRDSWTQFSGRVDDWHGEDPGRCVDQGVGAVRLWRTQIARHVIPKRTQLTLELAIESEGPEADLDVSLSLEPRARFRGRADVLGSVRGADVLIDHKMTGRSWPKAKVQSDLQSVAYPTAAGFDTFQFHIGVRSSTPRVQVLQRTITDADRTYFGRTVMAVRREIHMATSAGVFAPNRQAFNCSRRHCGFWRECEKRHGGTVKA